MVQAAVNLHTLLCTAHTPLTTGTCLKPFCTMSSITSSTLCCGVTVMSLSDAVITSLTLVLLLLRPLTTILVR
jgi:hypothetical protein